MKKEAKRLNKGNDTYEHTQTTMSQIFACFFQDALLFTIDFPYKSFAVVSVCCGLLCKVFQ
jgi:hypothetical protein